MFTLAIAGSKLLVRPHIPMLAEDNVRIGFFERDEFERVRLALPDDVRPVVTFAYLTGWRIPSEVLTLQWRQVDLKAGIVRLDPGATKTNKAGFSRSRLCRSSNPCSRINDVERPRIRS